MKFQFVENFPAVFIPDINSLVVADFHIGFEYELLSEGIRIPNQAIKFEKEMKKLIKSTGAEKLIILGDVKHKLSRITKGEEINVLKFLNSLVEEVNVFITLGNHDPGLENIVPSNVYVASSRGFRIKEFGFFHGHAWPSPRVMKAKYIFMGHIHPSLLFVDEHGNSKIERIFLVTELDMSILKRIYGKIKKIKLVVLPAYNRFLGGSILNKKKIEKKYRSPLWKEEIISEEKSEVYLLNGTYLGSLKIKKEES